MKKAMIAMSGGVDSSVAALLMEKRGYICEGAALDLHGGLSFKDAQEAAKRLDMPFGIYDFKEDFENKVVSHFIDEYKSGRTPNPCCFCNPEIKFEKMIEIAMENGADRIATGHYARIHFDEKTGRYLLKKGFDAKKDQSYMLYSLTQRQLSMTDFPVGELTKEQVRKIAREYGLLNADKRDSQDICFIPDGDYAKFIESRTKTASPGGLFVGTNGEIYAEHKGIIRYTIGQRKGLGLSFAQPMYVTRIDAEQNQVVLGKHEELFKRELTAINLNLIAMREIKEPIEVMAKIRYRHEPQAATAMQTGDSEIRVVFDHPQRAITGGQAVVLYQNDIVIGGATIQ